MKRILIAEDEKSIREGLAAILSDRFDVTLAEDGGVALSLASDQEFDLILSDVRMPGMDGLDLFREVKKHRPCQKFVFLTVSGIFADDPEVTSILTEQADAFLGKPYRIHELLATIERVLGSGS